MSGAKTKSGLQRVLAFLSGLVMLLTSCGLGYLAYDLNHILIGLACVVTGAVTLSALETACI